MSIRFLERHARELQREALSTAARSAAAPDDFWLQVAAKNQREAAQAAMRQLEIEYARETAELFEIRLLGASADPVLTLDTFLNFATPLNRAWQAAARRLQHGVGEQHKRQSEGDILDINLAGLSQRPPHLLFTGSNAVGGAGGRLLHATFAQTFQLLSMNTDDCFDAMNAIGVRAAQAVGEALAVIDTAGLHAQCTWRSRGAIAIWNGSSAEVSRIRALLEAASGAFTFEETIDGAIVAISEEGQLELATEGETRRVRFPLDLISVLTQYPIGSKIAIKVHTTQFSDPASKRDIIKHQLTPGPFA